MAISDIEKERLNQSMPVANDVKLGEIIQKLQNSSGGSASVAWADITGKPTTFAPATHKHAIADVTNLQTTLDGKLTATKAAAQANTAAADVAGLVTDFNALLAKLKAAGLMA